MNLLDAYEALLERTRSYFQSQSTYERARKLAYAHLMTLGRRTISGLIRSKNEQDKDWTGDYKFYSLRKWDGKDLLFEMFKECDAHSHWKDNVMVLALDSSHIKKSGKRIPYVSTLRDPLSPAYHPNLISAIRFIQASAIINPEGAIEVSRAIPIYFSEASPAVKPRKNAPESEQLRYKREQKERRISVFARRAIEEIRHQMDKLSDGKSRTLVVSVDGGFSNQGFLKELPEKVVVIARVRKDTQLFRPVNGEQVPRSEQGGRPRIYGERLPTPEEIRRDDGYEWKWARVFAAGKYHDMKYKVVGPALWKRVSGARPYRLFIIAPLRYRKSRNGRLLYRQPAYLLVSDLDYSEQDILQYYMLRWDIEVNHRDEKSLLGLGQAQVRSERSVERTMQFSVFVYSLLLLASIKAYGPYRTEDYLPLPKWDKRDRKKRRASTQDILAQFRREIMNVQLEYEKAIMEWEKSQSKRRKRKSKFVELRKKRFDKRNEPPSKRIKPPVSVTASVLYMIN